VKDKKTIIKTIKRRKERRVGLEFKEFRVMATGGGGAQAGSNWRSSKGRLWRIR